LEQLLPNISSARVTAASVLVSNIGAEVFKNGDIYVSQEGPGALWDDFLDGDATANITSLTGMRSYAVFSWAKGAYAYNKPRSTSDLGDDSIEVSFVNSGEPSLIAFSPYPSSGYLFVYLRTVNPTTAPSTLARYQVATGLQWTSRNGIFPGKLATLMPSFQNDLIFSLSRKEQFFENPLHLMALIPLIGSLLKGFGLAASAVTAGATAVSAIKAAAK
jgi:hypothetical protein